MDRNSHGLKTSHYWEDDGTKLTLGNTFEDGGWYIEIDHCRCSMIRLYEIPLYGGKVEKIGEYLRIQDALEKAKKLT